ncbi:MAG: DUF427 domain-containing protein [Planctomycetota bacterium]
MKRPKPDALKPGQRSVWDFPRPPAIERESRHVRIEFGGETIASSSRCVKVLETSHPPVYFFAPEDVREDLLRGTGPDSFCEWKGRATYFDVVVGDREARSVAFAYPKPSARFGEYANWYSFYARPMDACYVGDELVEPQPGDFYSGWITSDVAGPFKGVPGSGGW